jgi:osmotically-inducible protein OsmY
MRSDMDIQKDVVAELKWDPSLRDDDVAVSVREGVVTLAGFVDSYSGKWKAERIASKVKGVRAIANDLAVRLPTSSVRTDPEIARAAVEALKWNINVPDDRITVKVSNGWITLEGDVDWYYQKEAAERSVREITGVKGVTNLLAIRSRTSPTNLKERIREAFQRGALIDADRVTVEVEGTKAILRGTVRSYAEMVDAERAVRNAPGIVEIENKLTVDPSVFAGV